MRIRAFSIITAIVVCLSLASVVQAQPQAATLQGSCRVVEGQTCQLTVVTLDDSAYNGGDRNYIIRIIDGNGQTVSSLPMTISDNDPAPGPPISGAGHIQKIMEVGDVRCEIGYGQQPWMYFKLRAYGGQHGGRTFNFVGPYNAQDDASYDQDTACQGEQDTAYLLDHISTWMSQFHPDAVYIDAGIIDILHGVAADQIASNLGLIANAIRAVNPNAQIFMCTSTGTPGDYGQAIDSLNDWIRGIAQTRIYVTLVDNASGWNDGYTYNGSLPNGPGGQWLADKFYTALFPYLDN